MNEEVEISWERFLNPAELRSNLLIASIYISGFEIPKDSIADRIKSFFTIGFNENGPLVADEYKKEVLSRNRSPLYASLSWLKDMSAIDDDDMRAFEEVRRCRNELAHEMTQFITKGMKSDCMAQFGAMIALIKKIEIWWIVNVDMATDPDMTGSEVDESQIIPGSVIVLKVLSDIAFGSEEESILYYNELVKKKEGSSS